MFRITPLKLISLGIALIVCGLLLSFSAQPVLAQDDSPDTEPAKYVGSENCSGCHTTLARPHTTSRHALALQDVSDDKKAIQADFSAGERERTVKLPNEASARPFTADDIAFVIGAGRYVERYLYKTEQGYAILPAQWNVAKSVWEPYIRGNLQNWPNDPAQDWTKNCAGCHTTGLSVDTGLWLDEGVQCEACHGPGSKHEQYADDMGNSDDEEEIKTLRSLIVTSPDPQICGQCHSQGTDPTTKLPFPVNYQPGDNLLDPKVFTLVMPNSQDHWWASGHAKDKYMQFNEWQLTGHAQSLIALLKSDQADPACLTCHSADSAFVAQQIAAQQAGDRMGAAPQAVTLQTAKFGVTCTSCHNPHNKEPVVANLRQESYALCSSCHQDNEVTKGLHVPNVEMFEGKQVIAEVEGVPSLHFSAENGPRCATCHGPTVPTDTGLRSSHILQLILPGAPVEGVQDSCTGCHNDTTPEAMQQFITDEQEDVSTRLKAAQAMLKEDSPAWVREALTFVEGDGSLGIHNHRYTEALLSAVEKQLGIMKVDSSGTGANRPVLNPQECAECHKNEHEEWLNSPHAQASLNDVFRKEFAAQKQPDFCRGCHSSGYDPQKRTYLFEGIVCSTCHYTENNAKHPPAPIKIAKDSASCGECHSGAHAPSYDEWLFSKHGTAKIDCVDCHTPHNNGLRQGDVNTTCSNCHKDAFTDQVHMQSDMDCTNCHMKQEVSSGGVFKIKTGHSMNIDPDTCSSCHGDIHKLRPQGADFVAPSDTHKDVETGANTNQPLATPQTERGTVTEANYAPDGTQSGMFVGLAGGVIGTLLVVGAGLWFMRRRKLL